MKFLPIPITSCIKAATCTWSKFHKDNPFNSILNYFHLKVSSYHIQRKDLPWDYLNSILQINILMSCITINNGPQNTTQKSKNINNGPQNTTQKTKKYKQWATEYYIENKNINNGPQNTTQKTKNINNGPQNTTQKTKI